MADTLYVIRVHALKYSKNNISPHPYKKGMYLHVGYNTYGYTSVNAYLNEATVFETFEQAKDAMKHFVSNVAIFTIVEFKEV